jgi:2-polyprenyl-6-methoxyphenol hydroxylase-like FAD-dependent oxidoreductase
MERNDISRRHFLRTGALAGAGLFWSVHSVPFLRLSEALAISADFTSISPIAPINGAFVSGAFNGDDITHPHDVLWNKEAFIRSKGGLPTTRQQTNVAIVGGGMSGLLSAYLLRDLSPMVLEQAPRLGGNSKGERFGDTSFSMGAAYFSVPEKGSEMEKLLRELSLTPRIESDEESRVFFRGKGLLNLWRGETDLSLKVEFQKVVEKLTAVNEAAYPSIPWDKESAVSKAELLALDASTAAHWLETNFPDLHPHIHEYFQLYCWSSFGGSLEELSAAQFLNFVAAETAGVATLPGGNSAIADAIGRALWTQNEQKLRCSCMVIEVKNTSEGVEILYEDAEGKLQILQAKAVVMAAPKYVARYLMPEISRERDAYWKDLNFRAYVVANVLLKNKVSDKAYDVFCLEGSVPPAPTFGDRTDRPFTDLVYADWAKRGSGKESVLTIYKPYPFDGARGLISSDVAHGRIVRDLEKDLPQTLAGLGIPLDAVAGIRVTRWGHALPLAQPGRLTDTSLALLGAPEGKVAFANQDNYMNPAFESCLAAANAAAAFVRATL